MNMLVRACALALAIIMPSVALAQATGSSVVFPAGYAPGTSVCVKQTDGTCVPVSAANPLPVTGGTGGGGGGGDPSSTGVVASAPPANASVAGLYDGSVVRRWLSDTAGRGYVNIYGPLPSGTNAIGSITNTAFAISGSLPAFAAAPAVLQPDVAGSGTIAAGTANATYAVTPANGQSTAGFVVTGLSASAATLTIEASVDGSNWATVSGVLAGTGLTTSTLTADGQFRVNASGRRGIRLRVSSTGTGSITASSTLSIAPFDAPVPARDANGDLRVPTVTNTAFYVSLAANTSAELLAPNTLRIGFEVQCTGSAPIGLSRVHATLTKAVPDTTSSGNVDLVMPAASYPLFIPSYASGLGVTYYTTTAQACWGMSYVRQ